MEFFARFLLLFSSVFAALLLLGGLGWIVHLVATRCWAFLTHRRLLCGVALLSGSLSLMGCTAAQWQATGQVLGTAALVTGAVALTAIALTPPPPQPVYVVPVYIAPHCYWSHLWQRMVCY